MTLSLTRICIEHLPFVQRYASDPKIGATSNVPVPYPDDGANQWFRYVEAKIAAGSSRVFAIEDDGEFCGVIALNCIDGSRREAQIDYWVAVPFQQQGVATEAIAKCIEYASSELAIRRFSSGCLAVNEASARALLRNGFCELEREILHSGKFSGQEYRRFAREAEPLERTANVQQC
jgi:ribosomal-protein-alanine N-acetyltransferase